MKSTNQSSNQIVHQLILNQPIDGLVEWLHAYLDAHTSSWLARQHPADEQIKRTHTHYMIVSPTVHKNSFTKHLNKHQVHGSNMFGYLTVTEKSKKPYTEDLLARYILKGQPIGTEDMPIMSNNITEAQIKQWISAYHEYGVATPVEPEQEFQEEREVKGLEKQFIDLLHKSKMYFKDTPVWQLSLDQVRRFTFHNMLSKHGLPPQPSTYKRFACGIFYQLKNEGIDNATVIAEIMDFAY